MDSSFQEKLLYLMRYTNYDIETLIQAVLDDSKTDPHYSAVTAQNLIISYIEVLNKIGVELPFQNVAGYFQHSGFSSLEYELFESKRKKEATYYIGIQF